MMLFNQVNGDEPVNFIVLNGDLVGHGIAQDPKVHGTKDYKPELYEMLKETHRQVQALFSKWMPNTPVFFTFGNNDTKYHN